MTIWAPLNDEEYRMCKQLLEQLDAAESQFSTPYREHPFEEIRQIDEMRIKLRAAVDGYEATHREDS